MDQREFAHLLADSARLSPSEAADELDEVVHGVLRNLKEGKSARLPGLGVLRPGKGAGVKFRAQKGRSAGRGKAR